MLVVLAEVERAVVVDEVLMQRVICAAVVGAWWRSTELA
jgi:hypothetical protein